MRAKAFGVHAQANTVGAIFGALGAGAISELFGWRTAFIVLAVPTVVTLVLVRRVREPERGVFERHESEVPLPLKEVFPRLYAIRSLRYVWFAGVYVVGAVLGATLTLPFYFKDTYDIGDFGVGVIGAVSGLGAMVATFIGARIAQDRLNEAARIGVRWIAAVLVAVCGVLILFASRADTVDRPCRCSSSSPRCSA